MKLFLPFFSRTYDKSNSSKQIPLNGKETSGQITTLALLWILFLAFHALFIFRTPSHPSSYSFLARDWGFDNISYYGFPWIIGFYAIGIISCIPALNKRIYELFVRIESFESLKTLRSRKSLKYGAFILGGIIGIGVFRLFQIKYNFLGDMDIRVQQTVNHAFVDTEAMTMVVMYYLYRMLNSMLGLSGLETFRWVSYCSGGIFIVLSLLLADLLVEGAAQKALFFLFYIFFGTMQMFFGYAEIYCLPVLSVLVYLFAGVRYMKQQTTIIEPVITLLISIGLHLLSLALLPSLGVLLFYGKLEPWIERRKINVLHFFMVLIAGIPVLYLLAPMLGVSYFLIPAGITVDAHHYMTLFSPEHMWEFFNSQLLAAGTGFFLFVLVLIVSIAKNIKYDRTMWFFASGGLGMLYLTFLTNAVRGSGDWDLLAFPSIVYNVFGIYVILSKKWPQVDSPGFKYLLVVFLGYNIINTVAWIGVNASDRSITKIEHMFIGDPGNLYRKFPDELSLAINYESNGLKDKKLEFYKKAYEDYPRDAHTHYNYALALYDMNQTETSIKILENLINTAPQYCHAYQTLIDIYKVRKNDNVDLYRVIDKMFNAYITNPNHFKSCAGINYKFCFTKLRDFVKLHGNNQRVLQISQVLSQMK